jgi:Zn-finger protein
MTGENYKYFQNKSCEFFPCHPDADPENFNCLFCFCPFYAKGRECGGNFIYINGIKDCTGCRAPHLRENYDFIISELTKQARGGDTHD